MVSEQSEESAAESGAAISRWRNRPRAFLGITRTPMTILGVLFLVFLLATIFSQDWRHSLFDAPYRSGGSLNFFFYILFAVLTFWTIKDGKNPEESRQGGTYGVKWQKIWLAAFIVGLLTCFIGIEQKFNLIGSNFIVKMSEPASTLGGPIFFGNYILLLSFIALSFGIGTRKWKWRIFYILIFLILTFTIIFCAQKRGPLAGFLIGVLWFVFFYPAAFSKKWLGLNPQLWLKISAAALCILAIGGFYFLKSSYGVSFSFKNEDLDMLAKKVSTMYPSKDTLGSRYSSWQVSFESFREKPIFGWGPENFSVAFDKNYDPSLPGIEIDPRGWWGTHASWWDKPHNILIEYAISAGILGLLAFLGLLGTLFWQLQKLKNAEKYADSNPEAEQARYGAGAEKTLNNYRRKSAGAASLNVEEALTLQAANISVNQRKTSWQNALIAHGIQTTFLAYLVALFFSFDTPSTYIILFLLVGFSLSLTSSGNAEITPISTLNNYAEKSALNRRSYQRYIGGIKIKKWRYPIIACLFIILIWFVWSLNIKPLQINKEINIAIAQSQAKNCQGATAKMEELLKKNSFLNHYTRLKYIIILDNCIEQEPENSLTFVKRAWEVSKESAELRPTYIRSWIFLGGYTNMLIEAETEPEKIEELKKEANFAFEEASKLSPKRQETYLEWIKTDLLTGEYQKAKEKSKKCIDLNPDFWKCHWLMDLTDIYLGKHKEIDEKYAKSYGSMSKETLSQLAKIFGDVKYYPPLVGIYQNVISRYEPNNPQYYASLAFVYRELGMYAEAKKEAEYILKLEPKAEADVKKFLETLK